MYRRLIAVGVAAAALGAITSGASGSSATLHCGHQGSAVGNIQATGTSCSTARKVVHADVQGKKYDGWKCHSHRINTGASVTCKHTGGAKVTFQVAD